MLITAPNVHKNLWNFTNDIFPQISFLFPIVRIILRKIFVPTISSAMRCRHLSVCERTLSSVYKVSLLCFFGRPSEDSIRGYNGGRATSHRATTPFWILMILSHNSDKLLFSVCIYFEIDVDQRGRRGDASPQNNTGVHHYTSSPRIFSGLALKSFCIFQKL